MLRLAVACVGVTLGMSLPGAEAADSPQSEGASSPRPVLGVKPEYPRKAMTEGREAKVVARVRLTAQGDVAEVRIVTSGGQDFDRAVLNAVVKWKFEPSPAGGGEDTWVQVPVVFKLAAGSAQEQAPATGGGPVDLSAISGMPPWPRASWATSASFRFLDRDPPAAAATYARACVTYILNNPRVVYPFGDDRRRYGTAQVRLAIQGNGDLHSVELVRSSGLAALDDALLTTLWMSAPLPAPPAEALQSADGLSIVTTFHYIGEWQPAGDYEVRGYQVMPAAEQARP